MALVPSRLSGLSAEIPAMSVRVGNRSKPARSASDLVPALIFPGHHATAGTRCPPSYWLNLSPRKGPSTGLILTSPLSDQKNTSVFAASPVSSTVSRILPTLSSRSFSICLVARAVDLARRGSASSPPRGFPACRPGSGRDCAGSGARHRERRACPCGAG